MPKLLSRRLLVLLALMVTSAGRAKAAEPDFASGFRSFAAEHCVACHGPDTQKGRLRLDTLPANFTEKDVATTWVKVLDRVTRDEMPPRSKPRPAENETRPLLAGLRRQLHDASLAQQQRGGRVVLRRLNRTEYETTLRDLLATPVAVKELLPDDNSAAGFDNVGAVLDVSSVHLLRYQEAAEKVLRAVIPTRPLFPFKERRTGKQITEKMVTWRDVLGKGARLDGDTLMMHVRPWGHVPCSTAPARQAGRYRVRAGVRACWPTDGAPLPMLLTCRPEFGRHDNDVRDVCDVPANKAAVIEREFELKQREVIVFSGWTLPGMRDAAFAPKARPFDMNQRPGIAVEWVEIEGPLDPWPPAGCERLFPGVPLKPRSVAKAEAAGQPVAPRPMRDEASYIYDPLVLAPAKPREDAERLMKAFLPRAFRRPVSDEVLRYHVKVAHAALDKGLPFDEAMILGYQAVLCSPHFLFLVEPPDPKRGAALDDHAVASRLSYFLWSSMPDDVLSQQAAKGGLTRPEVLRAQVERMLNDPKGRRFTANFAGQWLELRNVNATSPDPDIYGEFDDFLFWSMPRETEAFFEEVLRGDLPLTDFVRSDWTFLNQRLARHYGISGVAGGELRKVKVAPGSHRGGVLTQASILKVTADGTRTSPVLRGKWVLDKILGQPPAPPPPDIPAIEPDIRGTTTIRQQLDKHRNTPACASCHKHIDPPGFARESFDVIGGYRDFYRATGRAKLVDLPNYPGRQVPRGPDVEKGDRTPDGKPFKDVDEYKDVLVANKEQLARNLAQKLLIYASGADLQFADREVVEQLVAKARDKNYGFRSLIHEVVQSRVFLNK